MHEHSGGSLPLDPLVFGLAALAVAAYLGGVASSGRRGRPWPLHRTVLWCAGIAAATASVISPVASAAHDSFVVHMGAHLLGGMLAPFLLVLAAPVTLALRTLPVTPARRVSRMLRSTAARVLAHPVTAGVLSVGGLWFIYLTPIFDAMTASPLAHLVVHAHLLAAGYLFTAAVIGIDPHPGRPPRALVAGVLVAAAAAHAILAKFLYANPLGSLERSDAEAGAQLMYYAGAWVEAAIIIVFCAQWYRAAGRRMLRPAVSSEV